MAQARALWFTIVIGPLAWLVQLETQLALIPWSCADRRRGVMLAVASVAMVLTLAGIGVGLHAWSTATQPGDDGRVARARFMATLGITLCVLFALVIAATALPTVLLRPCG